jgi:hypothetical protein
MSDYQDSPYMEDAQDPLEQAAQDLFAFLIEDKGFSLGPTERTAYNSTLFRYLQAPICVEIGMDFRDNGVDVYMLRLDGATVPKKSWMIFQPDKRITFLTLLRDILNVRDDRLVILYQHLYSGPPHGYHWAAQALDLWRDLVLDYIDTVLEQPLDHLFLAKG